MTRKDRVAVAGGSSKRKREKAMGGRNMCVSTCL